MVMPDISGNLVWRAVYDSFGKADVQLSSTITNNLRFPGQYFDEETGLHYNWNRYYDPMIGRYITPDPMGFLSGDINLYTYVGNDPINSIDPVGTQKTSVNPIQFLIETVLGEIIGSKVQDALKKYLDYLEENAYQETYLPLEKSASGVYRICIKNCQKIFNCPRDIDNLNYCVEKTCNEDFDKRLKRAREVAAEDREEAKETLKYKVIDTLLEFYKSENMK